MKLSTKLLSVFLVLCMLFSVSGCASATTGENSSLADTSSETSSISGGGRVETNSNTQNNGGGNNLPEGKPSSENSSSEESRNQTPGASSNSSSKDNSTYIPSFSTSSGNSSDESRNQSWASSGKNPSKDNGAYIPSFPSSSAVSSSNAAVEIPTQNTVNVPQTKKGRKLVWHDEFTASSLDRQKWHFHRTIGADDRVYTNDSHHAYAEDGNFILKAYRSDLNPKKFTLPEGLVTKNTMNFKYGYLEMRAKIPMRQGAWPSFWMLSDTVFQKASWMSEIDIFECFGHSTDLDVCLHKHNGDFGGSLPRNSKFYTGNRLYTFPGGTGNNTYHVFGLEWDPNFLKFSIDGNVYLTIPIDDASVASWGDKTKNADGYHDFHYIIINNELLTDGGWFKHSSESRVKDHTQFPFTYTIDYVRLYQKAGEELKLKADIDAAR